MSENLRAASLDRATLYDAWLNLVVNSLSCRKDRRRSSFPSTLREI
jgi:hypothetical protein